MLNVNALRAEIARNGMTQGQVAERIGITPTTFSNKIRNNGFGLDEADKLIELLGIENPAAIFFGQQVSCQDTSAEEEGGVSNDKTRGRGADPDAREADPKDRTGVRS